MSKMIDLDEWHGRAVWRRSSLKSLIVAGAAVGTIVGAAATWIISEFMIDMAKSQLVKDDGTERLTTR